MQTCAYTCVLDAVNDLLQKIFQKSIDIYAENPYNTI